MTKELKERHRAAKRLRKIFWNKWQEAFLRGETQKVAEMACLVTMKKKPTKKQIEKVREFING
jgi:hypothetical protein